MCHLHDDVQRKKSIANQELAMINRDTFFFFKSGRKLRRIPYTFHRFYFILFFICLMHRAGSLRTASDPGLYRARGPVIFNFTKKKK